MSVFSRIEKLRAKMRTAHVDAIIIPSVDPHMSEYPPEMFKTRRYITGFTGSFGTAVITLKEWGVWTDGRYYIQCHNQISPFGGVLFKSMDLNCPSIGAYLANLLSDKACVAINGQVCSENDVREYESYFAPKKISLRLDLTLAEDIWEDRPTLDLQTVWKIPDEVAGLSVTDKLALVRHHLSMQDSNALFISRLDSIAWLFNIRAEDIPFVPVPIAWALILPDSAVLFIELKRIPSDVQYSLTASSVLLRDYNDMCNYLPLLKNITLLMEPAEVNAAIFRLASSNKSISINEGTNPIPALKTIKTAAEISSSQKAYLYDCAALCEFFAELEIQLEGEKLLTEYDASLLLENKRQKQSGYLYNSFAPIIAYHAHAAMMHYSPKPETASVIKKAHLLLVDTGGHYRYGTTDITRTFAMGPCSIAEMEDYTTVTKAFIGLSRAVFPKNTPGRELDILSRVHVWRRGLDYQCGTGHGVGFLMNIHEPPSGFGPSCKDWPLKPGTFVSIEPGIYRENISGIRTENGVFVSPFKQTKYGSFMQFETMTYLPIDTSMLLLNKMDKTEIDWLNAYNAQIRQKLSGLLSPLAQNWMERYTKPI